MKRDIELNERIESYLNGELSPGEYEIFRKELAEDPSLETKLEMHRRLREIIEDGTLIHIRNELKTIHISKTTGTGKIKRITGFGGGILLISLILFIVIKKNPQAPAITAKTVPLASVTEVPESKNAESNVPQVEPASQENGIAKVTLNSADGEKENIKPMVSPDNPDQVERPDVKSDTWPDDGLSPDKGPVSRAGNVIANNLPSETSHENSGIQPAVNCNGVKFKADITSLESCNNKPTGSFRITHGSVTGGIPPYLFSLSRSGFRDSLVFRALFSGNYPVYVKDGNNCIGLAGVAQIGTYDCTYQAVFAPMNGEVWEIPVEPGREGTLRIFSKSGSQVYSLRLSGSDFPEWNGESSSGQQLPMGIYQFEIGYSDGGIFTGNVTIVK